VIQVVIGCTRADQCVFLIWWGEE